jgi:hypothetical protein
MFGPAAAALAFAACLATPVQGPNVKAPPFTGRTAPEYDVVDGRFAGCWRMDVSACALFR